MWLLFALDHAPAWLGNAHQLLPAFRRELAAVALENEDTDDGDYFTNVDRNADGEPCPF